MISVIVGVIIAHSHISVYNDGIDNNKENHGFNWMY